MNPIRAITKSDDRKWNKIWQVRVKPIKIKTEKNNNNRKEPNLNTKPWQQSSPGRVLASPQCFLHRKYNRKITYKKTMSSWLNGLQLLHTFSTNMILEIVTQSCYGFLFCRGKTFTIPPYFPFVVLSPRTYWHLNEARVRAASRIMNACVVSQNRWLHCRIIPQKEIGRCFKKSSRFICVSRTQCDLILA